MKNNKRFPVVTLLTVFSLMISLCSGILIMDKAEASSNQGSSRGNESTSKANKMSSDLHKRATSAKAAFFNVRVILQFNGPPRSRVNSILGRNVISFPTLYKSDLGR